MKINKLSRAWRLAFVSIIIAYIIALFFFVYALINIPKQYVREQEHQNKLIQKELKAVIDLNNKDAFEKFENENPIEYAITNSTTKKVIYSTVPVSDNFDLKNSLNKNVVASEDYFEYADNNVWLLQYYISPQSVFNSWTLVLFIAIASLVSLNFIIVVILFSKFIRPLDRLRNNVVKISKYQLDLISTSYNTEYDQISRQLFYFAKNLEGYIDNSQSSYTTLEKNLQLQNEKLDHKNRMLASLTHDLKAPLNVISLNAQKIQRDQQLDFETVADINDVAIKMVSEINEIGMIAYDDNYTGQMEEVNIVKILMEVVSDFKIQIKEKNINFNLDTDHEVLLCTNRLSMKQIMNNAISNICSYAFNDGDATVSCYTEKNEIVISFYNDGKQLNKDQLTNIFKLFYRVSDEAGGSGTGLYTIKRLVEELSGRVSFINKDNGVELKIIFKK